jgi:hypothetical protein
MISRPLHSSSSRFYTGCESNLYLFSWRINIHIFHWQIFSYYTFETLDVQYTGMSAVRAALTLAGLIIFITIVWNDVSRFFNRKTWLGNAEKLSRDAEEINNSFLTHARQHLSREQNAEGIVAWCALSIRRLYCRYRNAYAHNHMCCLYRLNHVCSTSVLVNDI